MQNKKLDSNRQVEILEGISSRLSNISKLNTMNIKDELKNNYDIIVPEAVKIDLQYAFNYYKDDLVDRVIILGEHNVLEKNYCFDIICKLKEYNWMSSSTLNNLISLITSIIDKVKEVN